MTRPSPELEARQEEPKDERGVLLRVLSGTLEVAGREPENEGIQCIRIGHIRVASCGRLMPEREFACPGGWLEKEIMAALSS